jgi:hypothetical protein
MKKHFKKEVDFTFIKAPHNIPNLEQSNHEQKQISSINEDTNGNIC